MEGDCETGTPANGRRARQGRPARNKNNVTCCVASLHLFVKRGCPLFIRIVCTDLEVDFRSLTTKTGYGTTPVWCRGASRNVEGCWGFPYLKIQKLPNFHFMLLIDVKFISKVFKICLRESSSFPGARLRLFNFSEIEQKTENRTL